MTQATFHDYGLDFLDGAFTFSDKVTVVETNVLHQEIQTWGHTLTNDIVYDGESLSLQITWNDQPQKHQFLNVKTDLDSDQYEYVTYNVFDLGDGWKLESTWDHQNTEWHLRLTLPEIEEGVSPTFDQRFYLVEGSTGKFKQSIRMGTNPYSSPLLWEDTFTTEGTILDIDHSKVTNLEPERREKMNEIQWSNRNPEKSTEYREDVGRGSMKAVTNDNMTMHNIKVDTLNMSCLVTKYENSFRIVLMETYEQSNYVDVLVNLDEFDNEQVTYSEIIVENKAFDDFWIRARLNLIDLKLTFELHDYADGINYKIIDNAYKGGIYQFSAKQDSEEILNVELQHQGNGFSTLLLAQPEQEVESQDFSSVIAGVSAATVGLVLTACLAKRKAVPTMDGFHRA